MQGLAVWVHSIGGSPCGITAGSAGQRGVVTVPERWRETAPNA